MKANGCIGFSSLLVICSMGWFAACDGGQADEKTSSLRDNENSEQNRTACVKDLSAASCEDKQFCDVEAAEGCRGNNLSGYCTDVPTTCSLRTEPVCGCDGLTYANDCMRKMVQVQFDHQGACQTRTCVPICRGVGTAGEGWYDGCANQVLHHGECGGCRAFCDQKGTRSEGWYSTCGGLLKYFACSTSDDRCVASGGICMSLTRTRGSCPAGMELAPDPSQTCSAGEADLRCCVPVRQ